MEKSLKLDKEKENILIEEIKCYFSEERDEELWDLAAKLFLEFIKEKIGPEFYNQALSDAAYFMNEKIEDLYSLEK